MATAAVAWQKLRKPEVSRRACALIFPHITTKYPLGLRILSEDKCSKFGKNAIKTDCRPTAHYSAISKRCRHTNNDFILCPMSCIAFDRQVRVMIDDNRAGQLRPVYSDRHNSTQLDVELSCVAINGPLNNVLLIHTNNCV